MTIHPCPVSAPLVYVFICCSCSFTRDPNHVHIMRKWEGDDPGMSNQKTPTVLLLNPDREFHSFGFTARDYFHDLAASEAAKWYYFDKFKMMLHHDKVREEGLYC